MPLVRQSAVNEAAGLDFANGIRSLMRQDPDIMLVGEIRDEPTASMAFRAAMTGHQVYSTLHTNSALGAVQRLLDIGILADVIAGNMIGIMGQRLVRRLCDACKEPYTPQQAERRLLALDEAGAYQLQRPVGCAACEGRGYHGRFALIEVLRLDADLDDLIARRATQKEITAAAHAKGFTALAADGARHVLAGATSLEEVARVVDLTSEV